MPWCLDCRHRVEPDPAEMAERYGAETTVRDWQARLICGECGSKRVDISHASLLLNSGASVKVVSSRLGHASAAMTLSVYAHLLPGADEDAARRIDDLLSGSKMVAKPS